MEENKFCIFTEFKKLSFEKNKEYKIKQNCYNNNGEYYFKSFSMIKEIEFEPLKFCQNSNLNYRYFLLNIKNYKKIYVYSYAYYDGAFIFKIANDFKNITIYVFDK